MGNSIVKDMKLSDLKMKFHKTANDNKSLRNSLNNIEYKSQVLNIISNPADEDENIKMSLDFQETFL